MNEIAALPVVRQGAVAVAAVTALILLIVFYSLVAGIVQHAAQRRSEARTEVAWRAAARDPAVRSASFVLRKVSLARASD
jgi:hypothetical protein